MKHLTLEDIKLIDTQHPNVIEDKWVYVFNNSFKTPKTFIRILLKYKNFQKKISKFNLFFKLTEEQFYLAYNSLMHDFMVDLNINCTDIGVDIQFSGYTCKILEISSLFISFLLKNKNEERIQLCLDQIKRDIVSAHVSQPYTKLFQGMKKLILKDYLLPEENLKDLNIKIDKEKIFEFDEIVGVFGNIAYKDAYAIKKMIQNIKKQGYIKQTYDSVNKNFKCQVIDTKNNAVGLFYYVCDSKDLKMKCIAQFAVITLQEFFFNQLRTIEQFGYIVNNSIYNLNGKEFIYFAVQSEQDVNTIKNRILKFIEFTKNHIASMSLDEFTDRKEALIDYFTETDKCLESYASLLWYKYIDGVDGLHWRDTMKELACNLTLEEVQMADLYKNEYCIITEPITNQIKF